ncbi:probable integral membrane protein [Fulvimarina pelagi HTCC2506]|uniref:Probable integral membrane protein n=1 Tax=Fulvimarina pelagi HTCC2506 TaxID=314231 RepID=Q0G6J4_9HYPH|nr:mechanosensitive ion channel domain-containing protein [Fulvimarina pelagi]EAU42720.1 probable integral membrane protein [Fulvimarina pelagi HTCC2506]
MTIAHTVLFGFKAVPYAGLIRSRAASLRRACRYIAVIAGVSFVGWLSIEGLQSIIYSATALAVAIVMALKEMISSALGGLVRSGAAGLEPGDYVEIGDVRGYIDRLGLFTTRLVEADEFDLGQSGPRRAISMPNTRFLEQCVYSQSATAVTVTTRFSLTFETQRSLYEIAEWWQSRENAGGNREVGGASLAETSFSLAFGLTTNAMARPCVEVTFRSSVAEAKTLRRKLTIEFLDWLARDTTDHQKSGEPGDRVLQLVA